MSDVTIIYQSCVINSVPDNFNSVCLDKINKNDDIINSLSKKPNEKYIFHVSLEMRNILCSHRIHPFVSDEDWQFNYDFLLSFFPEIIVNEDAEFRTFSQVVYQIKNGTLKFPFFIRPCSGNKSFSGQVVNDIIDINTLKDIELVNPLEMCIVSSVKNLMQETRTFIYMDGNKPKIIGATPYWHEGQSRHDPINATLLKPILNSFSNNAMLPDMFVADFAIVKGKVCLVELNSISTSGCYDAKNIDEEMANIFSKHYNYI